MSGDVLSCICKAPLHLARACPFSWFRRPAVTTDSRSEVPPLPAEQPAEPLPMEEITDAEPSLTEEITDAEISAALDPSVQPPDTEDGDSLAFVDAAEHLDRPPAVEEQSILNSEGLIVSLSKESRIPHPAFVTPPSSAVPAGSQPPSSPSAQSSQ